MNTKSTLKSFCLASFLFSSPLLADDIPPSMQELTIISHGSRMGAHAYLPAGEGPHPAVLLLHGYPGNEKNQDTAQSLRRAGYTVVTFYYRGAWGSEGEFGYQNAEHDVLAALKFMRGHKMTKQLRINPEKISLVGHSMGGHMTLAGFTMDKKAACAVAMDNVNLGGYEMQAETSNATEAGPAEERNSYADNLFMLKGWSGKKAMAELASKQDELDLGPRLKAHANGRPVLLIPADSSVIDMKVHITPLMDILKQAGNTKSEMILIKDDHAYSSNRGKLASTIITFLDRSCR